MKHEEKRVSLLAQYNSPQRPPHGQKKVAVEERWPLWEGGGVI